MKKMHIGNVSYLYTIERRLILHNSEGNLTFTIIYVTMVY